MAKKSKYKIPGRKTKEPGALTETQYQRMKADLHKIIEDGLDDRGLKEEFEKKTQTESIRAMFGALAIPLVCMHDEFGFGRERSARLMGRIIETYKCIAGGYVAIEDIIDIAREELGIDVIEIANAEL